ncbi:MAG: two-component regulator propeller domain-containing protein [Vicinamibacterales bacterium]
MTAPQLPRARPSSARLLTIAGAVLAALLCAARVDAGPRPIRFEHLSLQDGLSQATVLAVHQDRRGFLWIGTEDGLNRFDGYRFRVYQHDEDDPTSLPGDVVWSVAEDAAGRLWVGTEGGGLGRWNHERDSFDRFRHKADDPDSLASDMVRALAVDDGGALWVGTRNAGVDRMDPVTGHVTHYRFDAGSPTSLDSDSVFVVQAGRAGTVWVGTDAGVNRIDTRTGAITRYALGDDRVRALAETRDGLVWAGTMAGGLHRLDPRSGATVRFRHDAGQPASLAHDQVRAIREDADGRLWVGTAAGLDLFDGRTGTFGHYRHDAAAANSLSDDYVMCLGEDRGGVLWVGTRSGGLNKWHPAAWQFGHVSSGADGLSSGNVTSFAETGTRDLWVGTFGGGLNRLDRHTGTVVTYRQNAQAPARPLADDRVMALAADRRNRLWIGTYGGGLARLDLSSDLMTTFTHDAGDDRTLGADGVMSLLEDRRGRLWVGTFGGGLNRFDEASGTFVRYPTGEGGIASPRVTCLAEDPTGHLWVGTDGGGLHRLDPETGRVTAYRHDAGTPGSLPNDSVLSIHVDPTGDLWLGTRGSGLVHVEWPSGPEGPPRLVRYGEKHGLRNDVVYGVQADAQGFLWLSTNNGLYRFDRMRSAFTAFTVEHGLQANEFNFGAHYRTATGELVFGGLNGFNHFVPATLVPNRHIPPVVLTSYLKFNRPVALGDVPSGTRSVDVGYRDSVLTFEFAALDFTAPHRNTYRYQLEGFDRSWLDLGTERRVTFTNLDPGRYTLRVQAANNDGTWNEQGLALALNVEAPPWRRWWAYGLYGLVFSALAAGIARRQRARRRQAVEYQRRLEVEVRERTLEIATRNHELELLNHKLTDASVSDPMTGLRNRRFLFEHVARDIDECRQRLVDHRQGRAADREVGAFFMILDIDHFKTINDTLGHPVGDQVILEVVSRMRRACRERDVLIRWGGDEFLVIGRNSGVDDATALAERLRASVSAHPIRLEDGTEIQASCSIGFACFPFIPSAPQEGTWEDTLALSDFALYAAKRRSRNAWAGFSGTPDTPATMASLLRETPDTLEQRGWVVVSRSPQSPPVRSASA